MKKRTIKIGMFTTGHPAYWSQMPIKDEIRNYAEDIEKELSTFGEVLNAGIIDNIHDARKTEELFISNDVDIIVIHAGTYGNSSNILPCVRRCHVPILTLHLQPVDRFSSDATSVITLPKNAFSNAGEIGAVLKRAEKVYQPIAGRLYGDKRPWEIIETWCDAVFIKKCLRNSNIGVLGNYYPGMCDLYIDGTLLISKLGVHLEFLEYADLRKHVEQVSAQAIQNMYDLTKRTFDIDKTATEQDLIWPVTVAVGMERLVDECNLDALVFHNFGYPGSIEEKIGYSMTLGGSLLTSRGIPCTAEGDIIVSLAMLILMYMGAGATQSEINVADFDSGVNYITHSGPGDISIAHDKPFLRRLDFFHGKRGSGLSCEFNIQHGPITLLSLTQSRGGKLKCIVTEGESVPGVTLATGNTNTRVKFHQGIEKFVEQWTAEGPSHHSAMGIGHRAEIIKKIAEVLDIEIAIVE